MVLKSQAVAIVDDDEFVLAATVSLMRSAGVNPQAFHSAESFLDVPLEGFDCLISDVRMSGLSGLQLQEILMTRAPHLPIIILTAFPTQEARARALANGAAAFYGKPCDPDILLQKLADILGPLPFELD